jgi:hypothetical protein
VAGWIAHALTERERLPDEARARGATADRFERAIGDGRRQLKRAIRAYHTTVSRTLENADLDGARGSQLETLARALSALASAVDYAVAELDERDPLAMRLRTRSLELRELALDVVAHSRREELPTIFDELEHNLISVASTILATTGREPASTAS